MEESEEKPKLDFPFNSLKTRTIDGIPGLVTVVAQDADTKEVLMVAYANQEALEKTLDTKKAHYYSTSRKELWCKGETSGNTQEVKELCLDCDGDAVLYLVEPKGAACHEGYRTCFFKNVEGGKIVVKGERLFDPKEVYGKE
ncbi:phosphoribosyl-AMP cyclohydrolase [Candidatus Altiarchaeota archaeon]